MIDAATKGRATGLLDWLGYQIGDPCEIAELDKDVREAVRAQQFRAIAWMTPVVMTGKFICALAMAIVLVQTDSLSIATGLWVAVAMSLSIQGFLYWLSHRGRGFPSRVSRHRRDQFVLRTFGLALVWTVPGALFLPGSEGPVQSFMLALCAGMIAGGAISLYAVPLAAIVYCSVVALGGLIGVAQTGPVTMLGYVMVTAGFMFVVVKSILRHAEVFVSEFVGRMELDQKNALIERLLRTTEIEAQEERRQSEARLVHAQKMEAIGQLTGGIAHDFNNLLAAIQGNAELLELEGRADKTLVEPILKSTQRGSDLVARLLSFARRQVLRPRTVAVGALIENTIPLIRRTLGAEIRIETKIDDVVWPVHVDGAQLEASLINLSLNAFDALSGHGRLVISCSNTKARNCTALAEIGVISGDFVRIEVSDDGKGMAPHTMERAVDPFFTTKGVGQGSGLGLSMVYGFVRQSGGYLWIDSALGEGTSVQIYLPRLDDAQAVRPQTDAPMPLGQREVVLIVEDDPAVRRVVGDMLASLNYRTAFAADVAEARRVVASRRIDLVLSDVILPGGQSGLDLGAELAMERPNLPVLFVSGYTGKPDHGADSACPPDRLLYKPFDRSALARFLAKELA